MCLAHVLRDLTAVAELYPGAAWPTQLAAEMREMIHRATRPASADLPPCPNAPAPWARAAVAIGLAHTARLDGDARPGARKARLPLEAFRDREDDFLRFTTDLRIPPTSNQAERDLRPSKIQENISGRPTGPDPAKDRYLIRGVLSAVKHAVNHLAVLHDAFTGITWLPPAALA